MIRNLTYKEELANAMNREVYENSSYRKEMIAYWENGVSYGLFQGLKLVEYKNKEMLEGIIKAYREDESSYAKKVIMLWDEYIEDKKREEELHELLSGR